MIDFILRQARRPVVFLILLALGIAAQRSRTYDEPFDRDVMTYAVIGHEILHGACLYSDIFDHKPPAIYVTFAASELCVGYGPAEIYLVNVAFMIMATVGMYCAGRTYGLLGGMLAAALWVLFAYDVNLQGNQANTELCTNALLSSAFAALLRAEESRRPITFWGLGGIAVAAATLYKHVAFLILPLWGLAFALSAWKREGGAWNVARRIASFVLPAAIAWAVLFEYLAFTDRSWLGYHALFTFNQRYTGNFMHNAVVGLAPARLWPSFLTLELPLLFFTCLGLLLGLMHVWRRQLTLLAYAISVLLMVAVMSHGFPHYYQLYLPVLVIGATFGVFEIGRLARSWEYRVRAVLAGALLVFGLWSHFSQLRLGPSEVSQEKYGNVFLRVRAVGEEAAQRLQPGETLFLWGIDPGVYYYARTRPITQLLWVSHLYDDLTKTLRARLREDLRSKRPDLIILDEKYPLDLMPLRLREWLLATYRPLSVERDIKPFRLLARANSDLAMRAGVSSKLSSRGVFSRTGAE